MESEPSMDARIEEAVNELNAVADQHNIGAISKMMFVVGYLRGQNETLRMRLKWAELDQAKYQKEVYGAACKGLLEENNRLEDDRRDLTETVKDLERRFL